MFTSARSWGCTGLFAVVLTACSSVPMATPSPVVDEPPAAVMAAALEDLGGEAPVDTTVAPSPATTTSTSSTTSTVTPAPLEAAAATEDPAEAAPMQEAPPAFEGPAPEAQPAVFDPGPAGGGIWAVVIGIDDYPGGSHDLLSAGNDARDMDAVLARAGSPPEQRLRLTDGQATADNIRRSLDWLVDRAGPDATAVFFFAGHVRDLGGGTEAMVGSDGGVVHDKEVARRLRGLHAARTWIVLAACYAGGFDEVLAPGRILTAAAPAGRLAYENLSMRRSYLVEYVLRQAVLNGRAPGPISVESAFAWGEAAIRKDYPDRVPVQFDRLAGDLPLGGAGWSNPPPPPRQDPPPPPPRREPPTTTTTTPPPEEEESCGIFGAILRCPEDD